MKLCVLVALVALVGLVESYRHVPSHSARRFRHESIVLRRSRRHYAARDPVRERAKANYDKVVQELNDRFRNYKENCFPRPKGCLCRIGMDRNGRDITKRFKDDNDCKTSDPNQLDSTRGVHDARDRGGKKAPDYGQRGGAKRTRRAHRRAHHRRQKIQRLLEY